MRDGSNFSEITVYYNYEYEVKNYLAVLAHELSHAYQIAKGRPTYIKEEYNEYFTDALIVYLGFGKMYLDGMQKVEKDFKISTLTYSSKKLKLGYLSKRNITTLIQYRERLLSEKKELEYQEKQAKLEKIKIEKKIEECIELTFIYERYHEHLNNLIQSFMHKTQFNDSELSIVEKALKTYIISDKGYFIKKISRELKRSNSTKLEDQYLVLKNELNDLMRTVYDLEMLLTKYD